MQQLTKLKNMVTIMIKVIAMAVETSTIMDLKMKSWPQLCT